MTQQLTWNLQIESGARHATFNSKAILSAFGRFTRYFDVVFPQELRPGRTPWMRLVTTPRRHKSGNPRIAAWTTGRSIYFPTAYRFSSFQEIVATITHEMGHVLGGYNHAPPGHVMSEVLNDVYLNFTKLDMNWMRLTQRTSPKPWNEPNVWRPAKMVYDTRTPFEKGFQTIHFGHGSWSDRWHQLTARTSIEKVEE
jgi:hypothetical protein